MTGSALLSPLKRGPALAAILAVSLLLSSQTEASQSTQRRTAPPKPKRKPLTHASPGDTARVPKRIFVPRQHKGLQAAIDAAIPGDTIWVSPGTYKGPFVIKKRLVLFGDGGPSETILDGGNRSRVVHVEGVSRGGIYGFRIQNGKAPGGGGIYCLHDTTFSIGSCEIRSNSGAGIAVWQSNLVHVSDTEIADNEGSGLTASDSRVQLIRANFRNNRDDTGGGVGLVNSSLQLASNCLFEKNRASGGTGGGLYAEGSTINLLSCTFRENSAAAGGGGVAVRDSSEIRVRSTLFTQNRSNTAGGLLADNSWVDIQQSIFAKNRATMAGSGLQILGRKTAGVNPMITNNTFYRNGVDSEGSSIFTQDVSPDIVRNIFVVDSTSKNQPVGGFKGAPRFECNLIHLMDGMPLQPSPNTLTGNPLFCDAENGDYHVRDLSPAWLAPCGKIGALGTGCRSFRVVPSQ